MFVIQKFSAQFQKFLPGIRVLVLAIVLVAFAVLSFQSLTLHPGNSSTSVFPVFQNGSSPSSSSSKPEEVGGVQNWGPTTVADARDENQSATNETDEDPDDSDLDGEESQDDGFSIDLGNGVTLKKVKDPFGGYIIVDKSGDSGNYSSVGNGDEPATGSNSATIKDSRTNSSLELEKVEKSGTSSYIDEDTRVKLANKSGEEERQTDQTIARNEQKQPWQSGETTPSCGLAKDHVMNKKREKRAAVTISEMNQILSKNRGSSCSMKPLWSSPGDQQILEAKAQILTGPIVEIDPELYSPVFRNLSMFKRSYDLMEKMLKVFIYKEGEKPIFHEPPLTGIYASEGWFMKQMERSRHFVVDDPGEAHLFYMPFSSSRLRFELHVRGSHHRNLIQHLKSYVDTIADKYPFWNRTGGADHFLAACHDWAPGITGQAMGNSIRALCNADVTGGFELGKDVSLPETNVRTEQNPLRDLGGKPAKKRPVLAFFAGRMHGYLRPLLLQHWENRDPDVKVFGPLHDKGKGKRRKTTTYVQYMKNSRYCLCPRGYEVNSPRVVEAIFYECVPVIIADNFVPPFFEVLDWEAFSVVVAEKDVPRLKEILVAIPRKKYLALQTGVKMVQRHFLWHSQPAKYDLFHMILHSVWFNRVFSFHAE